MSDPMTPFFDAVRKKFGSLTQNQVNGLKTLFSATGGMPLRHRAYIIATAWHETGPKSDPLHMTPRTEKGSKDYFDKYNAGTAIGARLGGKVNDVGQVRCPCGVKFTIIGEVSDHGNFTRCRRHS